MKSDDSRLADANDANDALFRNITRDIDDISRDELRLSLAGFPNCAGSKRLS
jgi:hypothetical protein